MEMNRGVITLEIYDTFLVEIHFLFKGSFS